MIRIIVRDIYSTDATLLGDFAPSEVPEVESLIAESIITAGEMDSAKPVDVWGQFVLSGPARNQRWCYEISYEPVTAD